MSESEFIIRPASMADLKNLKPLWLEFMSYHEQQGEKYKFFPQEWPAVLNRFVKSLKEDHAVIFLAENQSNVIGYAFGFIFTNFPGYFPKEVGFINDFIISKLYQNRGVGVKLFDEIEKWFQDQGVKIIQLYVSYPNISGKKFWQNRGFENYLVGLWKGI